MLRDLFIVTSVIIPHNSTNWDSGIRSLATPDERFAQTVQSVKSIRTYVPSAYVVLVEGTEQPFTPQAIQAIAPDYFLQTNTQMALEDINSPFKARGESRQILEYLDSAHFDQIKSSVGRIFKLSGRYELTSKFDISRFCHDKITLYAPNATSTNTVLYSVPMDFLDYYTSRLIDAVSSTYKFLEDVLFEPRQQPNKYHLIDTLGVQGRRSYNNELWCG